MSFEKYPAGQIENKWRQNWENEKLYEADFNTKKPTYYNLVMFPYPSGDKLHVGHWYNFGPADSWGRFMRMHGHEVFSPMGFDSFGLPAENYAIKTGVHPNESIKQNVATMVEQLKRMGCMYDWSKMVNTSQAEYYRWTQWLFLKLYEHGLAEKRKAPVNWCPSCQTVLANEQVLEDGHCERCGSEVEKKKLTQWFWKITQYSERLLNHEDLDWPEKTILMQKNWIGRKEGINISYDVEGLDEQITVFTTRPDTNFGATFIVVAPECDFITDNMDAFPHKEKVQTYAELAMKKSEIERVAEGRKKTGEFTGLYAINNLTGKKMPIYISDFVLANVGTGAVVGVPGHDMRDFEFAVEKGLEIIRVVIGKDGDKSPITTPEQVQEETGIMINSGLLDGLDIHEATKTIMDYLEEKGWGERVVTYRLRDWLVSRQRYWGAPIPIVYDPEGNAHPVPEEHLPWVLPTDVEFKPTGVSPLAASKEFVERTEKIFGKGWTPDVDTMDTFVCSSFYYLRYLAENNQEELVPKDIEKNWMPVDMYIGGPEHACMHLLYARFVNMALKDFGYVSHEEPFKRLVHQGLITHAGAKMSKSKGNVVSPDSFVDQYGSDVFRMYLMFMGPFTDGGDWNDRGITGIARFLDKLWNYFGNATITDEKDMRPLFHKTIMKTSDAIQNLRYNVAISNLMEAYNEFSSESTIGKAEISAFVQLIAPMAPHFAEEIWRENLKNDESIFDSTWPEYDKKNILEEEVELVVQINGKVRGKIVVPVGAGEDEYKRLAKEIDNVQTHLEGKSIVKEIYVPNKLVNIVVK